MTVPTRRKEAGSTSTPWATDSTVVRRGTLQRCGYCVEYQILQPAPSQWVVMAVVLCSVGSPRTLVVTDGRSEDEALQRLNEQLHQFGTSYAVTAFATDWAMSCLCD